MQAHSDADETNRMVYMLDFASCNKYTRTQIKLGHVI